MSDELKHECAVAMVVLRKPPHHDGDSAPQPVDFGGTKLSLLLEKQHNRGQDGAGVAILSDHPELGTLPYWISKSASSTALADVLAAISKRQIVARERIFLGHLRYATFGRNEVAFCHPFLHEASELSHTLFLAGNFNLTNTPELFADYSKCGAFPTSKADGYLICEMIAHELTQERPPDLQVSKTPSGESNLSAALSKALANADGAWTLCGMTGDGWAFATRDPHGIRPGYCYIDDNVVVVASERPAIQAAFDVPPEAVTELPPGHALIISPTGEVSFHQLDITTISQSAPRPCSFERIYFSRANDADIHRERKALGAALVPQILKSAEADLSDIFFSYIPNSARIAFHGLLEELFRRAVVDQRQFGGSVVRSLGSSIHQPPNHPTTQPPNHPTTQPPNHLTTQPPNHSTTQPPNHPTTQPPNQFPRFGEIAVKDAKFRTFIADAAARREFYKHVYDVTYGLVRPGQDTLVVLDDSIVRGNTMKNAILPMLDRLGPKRIVIASSAPPIRYPDCYGIDMSTLDELVAFRALVNLLGKDAETELRTTAGGTRSLAALYARFTEEEHCAEIARLLTPPGMKAEVAVVYQTVENLHKCLGATNQGATFGDWYFTGDYPTPGGYKVLHTALENYLEHKHGRSY